uniref:Uncharacterized protein n=1 Tax=Oryza meridionalis TaxID=40149 RepID=A0A0E0EG05_9ORYZ
MPPWEEQQKLPHQRDSMKGRTKRLLVDKLMDEEQGAWHHHRECTICGEHPHTGTFLKVHREKQVEFCVTQQSKAMDNGGHAS